MRGTAQPSLNTSACFTAAVYVYTANQQPQPAPNPAGTNRRMAAAQDYFQQMLGQAPLGRGGTAAGSGGRAPVGQQASADPWTGRGRPRKLTDN